MEDRCISVITNTAYCLIPMQQSSLREATWWNYDVMGEGAHIRKTLPWWLKDNVQLFRQTALLLVLQI